MPLWSLESHRPRGDITRVACGAYRKATSEAPSCGSGVPLSVTDRYTTVTSVTPSRALGLWRLLGLWAPFFIFYYFLSPPPPRPLFHPRPPTYREIKNARPLRKITELASCPIELGPTDVATYICGESASARRRRRGCRAAMCGARPARDAACGEVCEGRAEAAREAVESSATFGVVQRTLNVARER